MVKNSKKQPRSAFSRYNDPNVIEAQLLENKISKLSSIKGTTGQIDFQA